MKYAVSIFLIPHKKYFFIFLELRKSRLLPKWPIKREFSKWLVSWSSCFINFCFSSLTFEVWVELQELSNWITFESLVMIADSRLLILSFLKVVFSEINEIELQKVWRCWKSYIWNYYKCICSKFFVMSSISIGQYFPFKMNVLIINKWVSLEFLIKHTLIIILFRFCINSKNLHHVQYTLVIISKTVLLESRSTNFLRMYLAASISPFKSSSLMIVS